MSDKNVKRKAKEKFKGVKPKPLRKHTAREWQEQNPKKDTYLTLREMRIQEALSVIGNYEYTKSTCRFMSQKWGVTRRSAERYFAVAYKRIAETWQGNEEKFKAKFLQELDNVKRRAKQSENIQAEIQAINSQVKLMGLEVSKTDVTSNGKSLIAPIVYIPENNRDNESTNSQTTSG